jgi:predicted PurR-regulated permease PerM
MLLLPVVQFLERHKFNKFFAIFTTLLLMVAIMLAILYFLSSQVSNFFHDFSAIKERLADLTTSLKKWVSTHFNIGIRQQNAYIKDAADKMKTEGAGGFVGQTVLSLTEIASYIFLLPLYTFLILYYREIIRCFLIRVFKAHHEDKVKEVLSESCSVSQSYLAGLGIELAIVFALNVIGFLILGIKYAVFLALVAALLNLVPYIGMLVANLFCMVITLISSDTLSDVFWVGVILAVVQVIDNNILMPMIVGSKVKINAMASIVGVLVGGAICGVSGMFLSIPGLAILKVICDRVDGLTPYGMLMGDTDSETIKSKNHHEKK